MNYLYRTIFLLMVFSAGFVAAASEMPADIRVTEASMTRNGDLMSTSVGIDLADLDLNRNQAVVVVPMLVNGADTLLLDGVGVYGRTRWYQYERAGRKPLSGNNEISLRYRKNLEPVTLNQNVEYADWMNGSQLKLRRYDYGCAGCQQAPEISELAYYREVKYEPVFIFQEAVAETIKTRELSGRAYVDFPVNKIVIYPDYRNNTYELGKIIATIDSVKNDSDITVTSLFIKGTASPEGPYDNNVYLAKNRTEALKEYVGNLYKFPPDFIKTDYDPVDWAGLREWLEEHNLSNKEGILAIVNSDIEPYARNSKIRSDYPEQYDWLLKNVYPALRHSDYRIEYTIRQFSDVSEIAEVMRTAPQKLSLNEMYLLANSLEPGSDAYNEVFDTAVRMYPNDETANLNAANSAMMRGDLETAGKYLLKAGENAKAVYARGVLAALQGDYTTAISLVEQAINMGLEDTQNILQNLREAARYPQSGQTTNK